MKESAPDFQWNLLPWRRTAQQQELHSMLRLFLKTLFAGIIFVVLLHLILLALIMGQTNYNHALEVKLKTVQSQSSAIQELQKQTTQLQANMTYLQQLANLQKPGLNLLLILPKVMPDGVYLTQIALQQQQASISGSAETSDQINQLLAAMKNESFFQHPQITHTQNANLAPPYHLTFTVQTGLGAGI